MNLKEQQNFINTRAGKLLDVVRLFGGYSPIPPLAVFMILTYRCNLSCPFCFQSRDRRSTHPDMTLEDIKLIEKNIRRSFWRKPRIHLFGGEPTINSDFFEIVRYLSGEGYRLSMTTNGVGLKDLVEPLVDSGARMEINMSLNTMNFEEQVSALDLFRDLDRDNRMYINLACPINTENQGSLIEIVERFQGSHARCITLQHAIFTKDRDPGIDPVLLKKQVTELKQGKLRKPVLFFPDIKIKDIEDYYLNPEFPLNRNKCVLPWLVLFIQPNGDVIACEEIEAVIGNAKNEKLNRIWNSKAQRKFRQNIQRNGISHPVCYRCCHRQYY